MKNKLLIFLCVSILLSFSGCRVESAQVNVKTNDTVTVKSPGTYMVNNSSSRKRYASPKAGTELYLDLVFRQ